MWKLSTILFVCRLISMCISMIYVNICISVSAYIGVDFFPHRAFIAGSVHNLDWRWITGSESSHGFPFPPVHPYSSVDTLYMLILYRRPGVSGGPVWAPPGPYYSHMTEEHLSVLSTNFCLHVYTYNIQKPQREREGQRERWETFYFSLQPTPSPSPNLYSVLNCSRVCPQTGGFSGSAGLGLYPFLTPPPHHPQKWGVLRGALLRNNNISDSVAPVVLCSSREAVQEE